MNDGSKTSGSSCIYVGTTKRGGRLLIRDGYEYVFKRNNKDGTTLWRCARKNFCHATIKSRNLELLHETAHCHEPRKIEKFMLDGIGK